MVAGERTGTTGERHVAVGKEELRLADPARIPQQLARRRKMGGVLRSDTDLECAEWNPAALTAPSAVHDALRVGKEAVERGDGGWRGVVLRPGDEVEVV